MLLSLLEKCPNTELYLVRIFLYSDWIRTRNNLSWSNRCWGNAPRVTRNTLEKGKLPTLENVWCYHTHHKLINVCFILELHLAAAKPIKFYQTCSMLVLHFRTPLIEHTLMHTSTLSHESWDGVKLLGTNYSLGK